MPSFNQWIGLGNATRDPMLKNLPGGTVCAEFGLACNRKFRTKGGEDREDVLFIDCSAFGKQAEVISQYVTKGKALMVCGRLVMDQWQDKQGNNRSKIHVVVENFQFVGGREGGTGDAPPQRSAVPASRGGGGKPSAPADPPFGDDVFDESSIPFAWRDHRTSL